MYVPHDSAHQQRTHLVVGLVTLALVLSGCAVRGTVVPVSTTTPSAPANATSPATASSSTSATPAASTAAPRTVTLVANGDLLWHNTVWMSAQAEAKRTGKGIDGFDFDPMFAALKPIISAADVAICHEEVPFSAKGGPYKNYPVFAAPPEIATWIKSMGWDACTNASNHSVDAGVSGLVRTDTFLDQAGVAHVGTFRSAAERAVPVIYTTSNGVKVGIVSGTYGLNGFTLPSDQKWAVSFLTADNILAQAKAARQAGADIVVVDMHDGNEYQVQPTAEQVSLAKTLTASDDVDLVIGEHVHVIQPVTKVNGKWVVYGMGNLVAQQSTTLPRTYEGLTVRFTFTSTAGGRFTVSKAEYIGTYVTNGDPIRVYPVVSSLASGKGPTARLQTARTAIKASVNLLGNNDGLIES
jgi:poly-gamma-glutamate synthesis protein (capsule biosynthesis protein)